MFIICIIDDLSTGNKNLIPENIQLLNCNINDDEKISNLLQKKSFDILLHFAGYVKVEESVKNPNKYFINNTDNAILLFETCYKNGLKNGLWIEYHSNKKIKSKQNYKDGVQLLDGVQTEYHYNGSIKL